MVVRPAEYSECGSCGTRKQIRAEAMGCDQCAKVMDFAKNKNLTYHDLTVFGEGSTHHIFCGVPCVFKWLRAFKPKKDYRFMSLPLFSGKATFRDVQSHLK